MFLLMMLFLGFNQVNKDGVTNYDGWLKVFETFETKVEFTLQKGLSGELELGNIIDSIPRGIKIFVKGTKNDWNRNTWGLIEWSYLTVRFDTLETDTVVQVVYRKPVNGWVLIKDYKGNIYVDIIELKPHGFNLFPLLYGQNLDSLGINKSSGNTNTGAVVKTSDNLTIRGLILVVIWFLQFVGMMLVCSKMKVKKPTIYILFMWFITGVVFGALNAQDIKLILGL